MTSHLQDKLLKFLEDANYLAFVEESLHNPRQTAIVPDINVEISAKGGHAALCFDAERNELIADVPVDLILLLEHSPELGNLALTSKRMFNQLLSSSLMFASVKLKWNINAV